MNKIIDIHSHILPLVDDGSKSYDESIQMLEMMIEHGVESCILTPHVQSVATKTERIDHLKNFNQLKTLVNSKGLNINLYLGAEVRYRNHLNTNYEDYLMANSKYLLIEFSSSIVEPIEEIIFNLTRKGFIPIIAHVERYPIKYYQYENFKNLGALLQVNAAAVLGREGFKLRRLTHKMLKDELVDFIASDSHNLINRKPNLREAYNYLEPVLSSKYLNKIFYENALKITEG